MARSKSTPEVIDAICERLMNGESLRSICTDDGMPGRQTVLDWLQQDPAFRAKYAHAREIQGDLMDDRILEVANACDESNVQSSRVKIEAYKWRASKLAPKKYGDRVTHVGDEDAAPVQHAVKVSFVKADG